MCAFQRAGMVLLGLLAVCAASLAAGDAGAEGPSRPVKALPDYRIEPPDLLQIEVDKIGQLDFVDSVAVENHDQRSVMLIHTPNGPEAIPLLIEQLAGLKVGQDRHAPANTGRCVCAPRWRSGMTWDYFKKTINVATMSFEVEMRQNLTDGFVLFGILLQPLIIAFMALWMLKEKGPDYSIFVVVGSGMTGCGPRFFSRAGTASQVSVGMALWNRWSDRRVLCK